MGRVGLMQAGMRPIYAGAQVSRHRRHRAAAPGRQLDDARGGRADPPGDIVVAPSPPLHRRLLRRPAGHLSFQARGARALVIDAGVRDVKTLTEMRFPVWSKAISSKGTIKATLGSVNIPVVCAGALVHPGDVIVADDDGVVCVPRARWPPRRWRPPRQREANEGAKRAKLAAGVLGLDMYKMREPLAKAGLRTSTATQPACPVPLARPASRIAPHRLRRGRPHPGRRTCARRAVAVTPTTSSSHEPASARPPLRARRAAASAWRWPRIARRRGARRRRW
jgi:4-hydroxy-4-methyl-2-oxoglutarate aldolase